MRIRGRRVPIVLAFLISACSDPHIPTDPGLSPVGAPVSQGELLGRAVARALADADHAAFVRDQMRASPYTRHRVAFQALLRAPGGSGFADAVARHLGTTGAKLIAQLDPMQTLEFYVDSKAQRLAWRGTPGVVVAAQMPEERRPRVAFRSDATSLPLDELRRPAMRAAEAVPVFYLRPSDGLAIRLAPQPPSPGSVIQDEGDGETGGLMVTEVPGKAPRVTQLAELATGTGLQPCQGCVASVASPDTTFLWGIRLLGQGQWLSLGSPRTSVVCGGEPNK